MKKIFLYNTLTRKKEEFKPQKNGKVSFYHCGPTVYWIQHIGNLRGMECADIVARIFRYIGYEVNHVRNYTDVGHLTSDEDSGEDKMEKGAKREGLAPSEIANKYIKIFEKDTKELNILEPNVKPKATAHIKEIIELIQILVNKKFAYFTDLAIYFDISKVKDYTKLSRQKIDKNRDGAGRGEICDSNKKNQADFVLWFFKAGEHKNAIQYWRSPFNSPLVNNGEGFPGWHIECSAMSKKYLGNTLDIHMGGIEHIPVHHTNEIAQSESANGVKFVNYWLHNEHLLVNNHKMSKSENTGFSISDIKEKGFKPLALRYFFLQAHYRAKQNFTWEALEDAQNGLEHLYNQVRELGNSLGEINEKYKEKFLDAISDDFNMPQALAILQKLLKSKLSQSEKLATILDFDKVLGIDLLNITKKIEIPMEIKEIVKARKKAREEKNWEEADKLRDKIEKNGYVVEDIKDKFRVYKK